MDREKKREDSDPHILRRDPARVHPLRLSSSATCWFLQPPLCMHFSGKAKIGEKTKAHDKLTIDIETELI